MFQSSKKTLCVVLTLLALSISKAQAQLTLTSNLNLNTNNNLVSNGSFETGIAANQVVYWATGTTLSGPFAVPPGWTSVGGTQAYALW